MKKCTAITKSDSKFDNYTNWLIRENLPYKILDWEKNNFDDINECSSLILTGGADIFPEFYNDWEDGKNREGYIPERDGFEFRLFDHAMDNNFPILGICRGMQLINCRLNGSLLSDIETIRNINHRKISNTEDRRHDINVRENSLLYEITRCTKGNVNSSHHQAIDRLGEGLMISAKSDDGIVESVEWIEKENKPFFLGIQWHPERMPDAASPFCRNIIMRFIEETGKTRNN